MAPVEVALDCTKTEGAELGGGGANVGQGRYNKVVRSTQKVLTRVLFY
jgi:hypothetical protein